jgi:uncharacterized membrane protein
MQFFKRIKILLLALILIPTLVFSDTTNYVDIAKPTEVSQDGIVIKDIKFNNLSQTTSMSYGFTGTITNNNDYDVTVDEMLTYYDSDSKSIATEETKQIIKAGDTVGYSEMSNLDKLQGGSSVSDIKKYTLVIAVLKDTSTAVVTPSETGLYDSYPYVIDGYNVDMVVNEDNSYDVMETIKVHFIEYRHGIVRYLPILNKVYLADGSTYTNHVKISNVKISDNYTTSYTNNICTFKIGSSDTTLIGDKTYTISYKYSLGKDSNKNFDELYYNIIGNGWDTVIGNITFKITMPKDFDLSKLGFSSGDYGETTNKVIYTVKGRVITGSYNGVLSPKQALTIRLALDDGYFDKAKTNVSIFQILDFVIPAVCLLLAYLVWNKYGKDRPVVETVEFYPPDNLNSLEIAYVYKGTNIASSDITSLLVYLANKGYLKITETKSKGLLGDTDSFKITKLKEYDGDNEYEKDFMHGLFSIGHSLNDEIFGVNNPYYDSDKDTTAVNVNEVTEDDLCYNFYTTIRSITDKMQRKSNKIKVFEKSSLDYSLLILLFVIVSALSIICIPSIEQNNFSAVSGASFFTLFYLIIFYACVRVNSVGSIISLIIFVVVSMIGFSSSEILPIIFVDNVYSIAFMFGVLMIVGMFVFLSLMPKRTEEDSKLYGRIKGFRRFLETAEKDELVARVQENPNYFFDILPYTYVLGISKLWIKKFETIALVPPSWYDGDNFDNRSFGRFMDHTINSTSFVQSKTVSSGSSGGGFSGGGFSGGGFSGGSSGGGFSGGGSGGGGGGSW